MPLGPVCGGGGPQDAANLKYQIWDFQLSTSRDGPPKTMEKVLKIVHGGAGGAKLFNCDQIIIHFA